MNIHRLALICTLLGVLLLAAPCLLTPATAAEIPSDGPRLFGKVLKDKTLLGLWTYGPDGLPVFVGDDSLLKTDTLHVIIYAPNAKIDNSSLELTLIWERSREIVNQTVVDGRVEESRVIMWDEVQRRPFSVEASNNRLHDTELDLPSMLDGARLTVLYGEQTVAQLTHHTSPAYAKLPRQVLQDRWVETAKVLALAAAAGAVGIIASKSMYRRGGNYVPELSPVFWILGSLLSVGLLWGLWVTNREALVLKGTAPLIVGLGVLVAFLSLQVWRTEPAVDIMVRIHDTVQSHEPRVSVWRRYMPTDNSPDPAPQSEQSNHELYIEDTWGAFFWRAIFGARTYLEFPETHRWNYKVINTPAYRRLYILTGDLETTQRPGLVVERPPGALLPRLRIERLGLVRVPVSPWAQDKAVMRVLAMLKAQQDVAEDHQRLLTENAALRAEIQAGIIKRARALLDQLLLALRAVRTGTEFNVAEEQHEDLKRATSPSTRRPPEHGGEGSNPAAPIPTPTSPGAGAATNGRPPQ